MVSIRQNIFLLGKHPSKLVPRRTKGGRGWRAGEGLVGTSRKKATEDELPHR